MNFTPDLDKLQEHSYGFSIISDDDGITSLLRCPLPTLDMSSSYVSPQPLSFEQPFDDPTMEPVPLGPRRSLSDYSCSPLDCPSGNGNANVNADYKQNLIDILDPVIQLVGSKRSSEDFLIFDHHHQNDSDYGPLPAKRQRTITPDQQTPPPEECTARFRPYQEKQWRVQFQKLIQYKLMNGHCCVPHSFPEDPVLARWVKRQRYQYKKFNDGNPTSTMTTRRIQELESVGFVWHSHHAAWQEKLNELKEFKHHTGHCSVPSHYPENVPLSTWVKCQRRQYKLYVNGSTSNMTIERFQELESLGFVFDVSKKK